MQPEIKGQCISLRPATLDDAGFILDLRNEPNNSLFINETTTDVMRQIEWMKNEAKDPNSFYFLILNKTKSPIGTISLYNIKNSQGEFGRWICNGSALESLESALVIHQYGFLELNLQKIYTRTLEKNAKVINFHRNFGASVSTMSHFDSEYGQDVIKGEVTASMFPAIRVRCEKLIGSFS